MANREFGLFLPAIMLRADVEENQRTPSRHGFREESCQPDKVRLSDASSKERTRTPTNWESDDASLIVRVADGDKGAISVLFKRYAPLVRAVAGKILRDPAEAEDLVQEVFLFIFRKAALFDPARGSARSWLVQITYHRAFDRRRYLAARHVYSNLELDEAVLHCEEPAILSNFYDDSMEAAIGRDALRRIAESLTAVQTRVLHMHFVEGRTTEEIAAILGQTLGNVRNHYYRALEKMRREVFGAKLQAK